MSGETSLRRLIASMHPMLREGSFVFVSVEAEAAKAINAEAFIAEAEGITLVLTQAEADARGLAYDFIASWITLEVHSSLSAVGLTAAFSSALGEAGISCNVLAGFYHDHLLVPEPEAKRAIEILSRMSEVAAGGNLQ